jgi:hypothetical protein
MCQESSKKLAHECRFSNSHCPAKVGGSLLNPSDLISVMKITTTMLSAAGMPARFALAKVGIVGHGSCCSQQPKAHGYIALRTSRELVTLKQGGLMVGPMFLVQHQIEARLWNALSGLKDLLSHVPLTEGNRSYCSYFQSCGCSSCPRCGAWPLRMRDARPLTFLVRSGRNQRSHFFACDHAADVAMLI